MEEVGRRECLPNCNSPILRESTFVCKVRRGNSPAWAGGRHKSRSSGGLRGAECVSLTRRSDSRSRGRDGRGPGPSRSPRARSFPSWPKEPGAGCRRGRAVGVHIASDESILRLGVSAGGQLDLDLGEGQHDDLIHSVDTLARRERGATDVVCVHELAIEEDHDRRHRFGRRGRVSPRGRSLDGTRRTSPRRSLGCRSSDRRRAHRSETRDSGRPVTDRERCARSESPLRPSVRAARRTPTQPRPRRTVPRNLRTGPRTRSGRERCDSTNRAWPKS